MNESRIAVFGQGYGGFVALHTLRKGVVPCGIVISPLTDLANLGEFNDALISAQVLTSTMIEGEIV